MQGNKRKQWGIIWIPSSLSGLGRWCKDAYGKPELHYSKISADRSRINTWGKTNYAVEKFVERNNLT